MFEGIFNVFILFVFLFYCTLFYFILDLYKLKLTILAVMQKTNEIIGNI